MKKHELAPSKETIFTPDQQIIFNRINVKIRFSYIARSQHLSHCMQPNNYNTIQIRKLKSLIKLLLPHWQYMRCNVKLENLKIREYKKNHSYTNMHTTLFTQKKISSYNNTWQSIHAIQKLPYTRYLTQQVQPIID